MAGLTEGQHIPNTIPFQGSNVYLLTDLITFDRPFFVGCIREPRKTIQKKNIPAHQYWFATHSKRTNTWALAIPENCKAKILISEEWVHNNIPRLTGNQDAYKYKPLPPLLELNEDEKFRDIEGNVHEVEVRGVRSREGIRFSCRDVARVFEMEVEHNIQRFLDNSEYEVFCSDGPLLKRGPSEQNMAAYQASTYITYNGLLKIIFASRSGTAYRFQDWATTIVYTAHLGTTEQRIDVAADIVGINAQMVKDVLTTCITSMPCVYLFNVGKIVDLRKHYEELRPFKKGFLFKWGRTNDLKRRTGEHIKTYGNLISSTLQLKYFSPVDNVYEVEAENEIRGHFHGNAIQFRNHKELIILDKNQLPGARVFYEDVYKKFSSEVDKLLGVNSMLERDAVYMKEIVKAKNERIEDLNRECEGLRSEMFSYQSRELEYQSRELEYKKREEEYKERESYNMKELYYRRERSLFHLSRRTKQIR
jgi:prophage antirepressor-like protein